MLHVNRSAQRTHLTSSCRMCRTCGTKLLFSGTRADTCAPSAAATWRRYASTLSSSCTASTAASNPAGAAAAARDPAFDAVTGAELLLLSTACACLLRLRSAVLTACCCCWYCCCCTALLTCASRWLMIPLNRDDSWWRSKPATCGYRSAQGQQLRQEAGLVIERVQPDTTAVLLAGQTCKWHVQVC